MADEQLYLTIEQVAESVRTSMAMDDAMESLSSLTEIIEKENNDESILDGRLHELTGQIFRSLLPAFVMTDADFKAPASLAAPTKAMQTVKDASIDWLIDLVRAFPSIAKPIDVDRVAYRRRMRMAVSASPEDDEEHQGHEEAEDGSMDAAEEDWSESSSDENTPPNDAESPKKKGKSNKKSSQKPQARTESTIVLDPVVALLERMAVRCPDKTEWRRSICDSIGQVASVLPEISNRYIEKFLLNLMVSDKAAWRIFSCEAAAACTNSQAVFEALLNRCRDSVPGVRSVAMKSASFVFVSNSNLNKSESFAQRIIDMYTERVTDEKPSVRRSAISVFDQVNPVCPLPLSTLESLSLDESLMVRKSSISSVVSLLNDSHCSSEIALLFCQTVLQMVTDVESTVVEKVIESFQISVIEPLFSRKSSIAESTVGSLLRNISTRKEYLEFSNRILKIIIRNPEGKKIASSIEKSLLSCYETNEDIPIQTTLWSFLDEISNSIIPSDKVLSLISQVLHQPQCLLSCLRIGTRIFTKRKGTSPPPEIMKVVETLVHSGYTDSPLTILHDAVKCYHAGLLLEANAKEKIESLIKTCEIELDRVIFPETADSAPSHRILAWHVSIMGELASLGYMPSAKGLTSIEAIATNRVYHNAGTDHFPLSPSLRAAAMVAFGRVCLEKESIAKRAVSKFAAHLSKEEHPVVRNNVLIVLADLCVVYTGLVDQYLPWVTTCLSDKNDLIRFQAAVVVSSLLAEDYIKFKGQIVYRLLYLLSDENVKIRYFVESVFSRILFLRHSGSLKTLFAETVCALNGYLRHPAFQGGIGNRDFCLVNNGQRRLDIYKFMLQNVVTTEQKFNSIVQLANSLLSAFVDEDATNGAVFIPEREDGAAGQVIIDTLYLLSCKELRLGGGGGVAAAAEEEEDSSREKKLFDAALQKKTIVENLVPLLIQLNTICEQKRSPLSRYVRECLKELIKEYKDEVMAIVHSDVQLAQEILYDLNGGAIVPLMPSEPETMFATEGPPPPVMVDKEPSPRKNSPQVEPEEEEAEEERPKKRTARKKESIVIDEEDPPKDEVESPKATRSSRRIAVKQEEETVQEKKPPSRKRRN